LSLLKKVLIYFFVSLATEMPVSDMCRSILQQAFFQSAHCKILHFDLLFLNIASSIGSTVPGTILSLPLQANRHQPSPHCISYKVFPLASDFLLYPMLNGTPVRSKKRLVLPDFHF